MSGHYYDIGYWLSKKVEYHKRSSYNSVQRMQVNRGEVWECDLGYNIGEEKNKRRKVLIVSNNRVNQTGKVIIAPITDAKNKVNMKTNYPHHNTWYLLYSDTSIQDNMFKPGRFVPGNTRKYSFLSKDSVIQCEEMRSVSKVRLSQKRGVLDPYDWGKMEKKLKSVFDIS